MKTVYSRGSYVVAFEDAEILDERLNSDGSVKSLCIDAPGMRKSIWISYGLLGDDSEAYRKGQKGKVFIPNWIVEKEKLL